MLQPRRRGNRSTPACLMVREMLLRMVEAGEQVVSYGLPGPRGPDAPYVALFTARTTVAPGAVLARGQRRCGTVVRTVPM